MKNQDTFGSSLPTKKRRTSQGYLQISYTPDYIGQYEVSILKEGYRVLGNPIRIYSFDPNLVKVENLTFESTVMRKYWFNIDASHAGQGFIRVSIKDSRLNDILPEIDEITDRKYLISFVPNIPGKFYYFILSVLRKNDSLNVIYLFFADTRASLI